jgi:hypothetical protein
VLNAAALCDEVRGNAEVTYFAAALGAGEDARRGHVLLAEAAGLLGLPDPPSLAEVIEDPARVRGWVEECGLDG